MRGELGERSCGAWLGKGGGAGCPGRLVYVYMRDS